MFVETLDARRLLSASASGFEDVRAIQGTDPRSINLRYYVRDTNIEGTVVDAKYDVGTVRIALLDKTAPKTTANFLKYVDAGRYDDSFVHRVATGFVVQNGGYTFDDKNGVTAIEKYGPVVNEYKTSNTRGTIAMAKLGGDPNSATNEWFYNLADTNASNLDNQNGGFTVFAKVIGSGMKTVDRIAALPLIDQGSPFDTLPVQDYDGKSTITSKNLVTLESVDRVATVTGTTVAKVTVSSSKSSIATASIKSGKLILNYSDHKSGTTVITVTATGVDGSVSTDSFNVKVVAPPVQTGTLAGSVYEDKNKNKKRDGEAGLEGWRVYLDANNDGSFDKKKEKSVFTDRDGNWSFGGLSLGTYTVRVSASDGYANTMSRALTLDLDTAGKTVGGKFGFRKE